MVRQRGNARYPSPVGLYLARLFDELLLGAESWVAPCTDLRSAQVRVCPCRRLPTARTALDTSGGLADLPSRHGACVSAARVMAHPRSRVENESQRSGSSRQGGRVLEAGGVGYRTCYVG